MKTLKEFLADSETQKIQKENPGKLYTVDFNRDPNRAIYVDYSSFLSPADGFIVYSKIVSPKEDILNIKGVDYTVNALLQEEIEEKCLIIGIFMTQLDVHINRIPTDGFIKYEKMEALKVDNLSMRETEKQILSDLKLDHNDMQYSLFNSRTKNRIYCPKFSQHYWVIQIADYEVDVICHFHDQNEFYTQSERFSVVRMGSQVDLIIPFLNKKLEFKSLVDNKIGWHVEAGVDSIVTIEGTEYAI